MVDVDGKDIKIVKTKLNSLRLDSLLKAGLGTAKKYYFSISIFYLFSMNPRRFISAISREELSRADSKWPKWKQNPENVGIA